MAYTGTGTQSDPYIPDTITSLYEVIDLCNASGSNVSRYIKLTQDIDCKDDPNYIGYMSRSINLYPCVAELYSDNNSKIIGLTVKDSMFIKFGGYVRNIEFKNCFFKPTSISDSGYVFYGSKDNDYFAATMENVKASIYVINIYVTFIQNSQAMLNNCSIYIDGSGSSGSYFAVGICGNYSNVILNNIKVGIGNDSAYSLCYVTNYCSVILKNSILWSNVSPNILVSSYSSYSYAALLNTNIQFTGGTTGVGQGTHNLVASDDYTGMTYTDVTGVINFISISDLQDNQKLIDLGFLP